MSKTNGKPNQTPDGQRTLPANIEAERVVLSYLMLGGEWLDSVTARDFAGEIEQTIWYAMRSIHQEGDDIERHRVGVELGEQGLKLVGVGYLSGLGPDYWIEGMRVERYVRKLHEETARRDILHHANILTNHVHRGDRTVEELLEMGASAFAGLQRGRNHHEPPPAAPAWPDPIREDGFYGLAGDLVRAIEPHTEADSAALLVQTVTGWGNLAARGPYYLAEADRHHTNEYAVVVGTTSKGRKGTSWGRIASILGAVDPAWLNDRQVYGIGSGEALIEAFDGEDRRVLVMEGEFARLLAVVSREGCTISAAIRNGWDTGNLEVRTREKKRKVSGAHLSMIAHITKEELLRRLDSTETANGFANRILWVCARRSKTLPHGGGSIECGDLIRRLQEATDFARKMGNTRVKFDQRAALLWEQVYSELSEGRPGMLGSMTSRAEAHVVRLSLIYALLDCSKEIRVEHLAAGLAVWEYSAASARFVWGDALGDPAADEILKELRAAGADGVTRTNIRDLFARNRTAQEIDRALGVLASMGLAASRNEDSGGRPVTRWTTL
jgi:hypothetical protein